MTATAPIEFSPSVTTSMIKYYLSKAVDHHSKKEKLLSDRHFSDQIPSLFTTATTKPPPQLIKFLSLNLRSSPQKKKSKACTTTFSFPIVNSWPLSFYPPSFLFGGCWYFLSIQKFIKDKCVNTNSLGWYTAYILSSGGKVY